VPTPRHISGIIQAAQGAGARTSSDVSLGSGSADPQGWIPGTIERSDGDLANYYTVSKADGEEVAAQSVLDGEPLEPGDPVWLVLGGGRALIAGLR
jgi:hypothetical protein